MRNSALYFIWRTRSLSARTSVDIDQYGFGLHEQGYKVQLKCWYFSMITQRAQLQVITLPYSFSITTYSFFITT